MISYMPPTYLSADIPPQAKDWRNNPEIFKFCRQPSLLTMDDQEQWMKWLSGNKNNKMFGIAIERHDELERCHPHDLFFNGRIYQEIGVAGLTNICWIARHAEFSLYIAPEYQGKGYARSALYNLLKHGFEAFNLNKIWGEIFAFNDKGLHLFTNAFMMHSRLGHRQHYFKDGHYVNTYIVDIMADEFKHLVIPCENQAKFKHEVKSQIFDDADISYKLPPGSVQS